METWWNYFGLKFDPFSTSPLSRESQKILLYKTKDISEKIDTEIFGLENSLQFIRLLVGQRGIGKTTVLHYIQQEAKKIPSIKSIYVDITFDEEDKSTDPSILIGSSILNRFIEEILTDIQNNEKDIWEKNLSIFERIIKEGGFVSIDASVQFDPFKKIHFVELKRISQWILKILENEKIKPLILIDNIDKNIVYAKKFLVEPTAQSIFEMMGRSNALIYISCKNNLIDELRKEKKEEEIGFVLDTIFLNSLKPIEGYNLIEHRLKSASNVDFKNPIDFETMQEIVNEKDGITRSIITEVKDVLQKAYFRKIKNITRFIYVSRDFVRKDYNQIYKKILDGDPTAKKGSEYIAKIYDYVRNRPIEFKDAIRYLIKIRTGIKPFSKELKFNGQFQLSKIIYFDNNNILKIHPSINILFTKIEENGLDLYEFFDWFIDSKIDEIDLTPIHDIFENEIQSIIDCIKPIKMSTLTKSYKTDHIRIDSGKNIEELLIKSITEYQSIGKEDWDEIAPKNLLYRIKQSLFYFCKAYAYYLASYYKEDFYYDGICERYSDWDNIYYFIIKKSVKDFGHLHKWQLINNVRKLNIEVDKNIKECPSNEELQKIYEEMHEPIKEICDNWKSSIPENVLCILSHETDNFKYDVFISHASEDKESFVTPLALQLKKYNVKIWYDDFTLKLGDSLRRSIDKGLLESRYGIVVLSKAFFNKEWPQKELDGLVSRDDGKDKVILPIWHDIEKKDIQKFSPILADRIAVSSNRGLDVVVNKILEVIRS
jgi:hypothetical protein